MLLKGDRDGPKTVTPTLPKPYLSCFGCKHLNHYMTCSGRNPTYKNDCTHSDFKADRQLADSHKHPTPNWCPFLKEKT
jgi:hypothetical protein